MTNPIAEYVSSRGQEADGEFNGARSLFAEYAQPVGAPAPRLRPSTVLSYDRMDANPALQKYVADYLATKLREAEGLSGTQDSIGLLARDWLSTANYGEGVTLRTLAERFVAEVLDGE